MTSAVSSIDIGEKEMFFLGLPKDAVFGEKKVIRDAMAEIRKKFEECRLYWSTTLYQEIVASWRQYGSFFTSVLLYLEEMITQLNEEKPDVSFFTESTSELLQNCSAAQETNRNLCYQIYCFYQELERVGNWIKEDYGRPETGILEEEFQFIDEYWQSKIVILRHYAVTMEQKISQGLEFWRVMEQFIKEKSSVSLETKESYQEFIEVFRNFVEKVKEKSEQSQELLCVAFDLPEAGILDMENVSI